MKKFLFLVLFAFISSTAFSQEEVEGEGTLLDKMKGKWEEFKGDKGEHLKYYGMKFEAEFDNYFDEVWNATIEAVESGGCQVAEKSSSQDENALFKGKIVSDFCIFAMSEKNDEVPDSLFKYSRKVPNIRGGLWSNGRIQYKIIIKEQENEKVTILIKGEISGREDNITNEVHFWESSGWFEYHLLEKIKAKLAS